MRANRARALDARLGSRRVCLLVGVHAGAAATGREWYHKLLVPFNALLFAAYITVLFTRLR